MRLEKVCWWRWIEGRRDAFAHDDEMSLMGTRHGRSPKLYHPSPKAENPLLDRYQKQIFRFAKDDKVLVSSVAAGALDAVLVGADEREEVLEDGVFVFRLPRDGDTYIGSLRLDCCEDDSGCL